jgi:hypothetical protein
MEENEISIGDAIRLFLKKSKLQGNLQALQITQIWEQLMGKTIARYTDKIEIYNQTLFIHTGVASLKQELSYQKEKIMERVNDALKEKAVKEVVIQ